MDDRYETYSNEYLVEKYCADNDEKAVAELFGRFVNKARSIASLYLGCREEAEDAVQDTFIKIVRKKHRYNPKYSFVKWFYAVLRNECKDHLRKRKRQPAVDIAGIDESSFLSANAEEHDAASLDLLSKINIKEGAVIRLRIVESMSYEEISSAIGISVEAAKKRAQRGLAKLRGIVACEELHMGAVKIS